MALAAVGDEGHAQRNNLLHLFQDDLFHQFCLFLIDIEVQLVVYLQDHLAFQLLRLKTLVDADHCQLDDIGRAALDRGVDGVALGITADNGVARVDIRQVTFPFEDGLDIAVLASGLDALVHVFLDSRIGLEITLDQLFRFGSGNAEPFGQSEGRDAIDDTEVGGLRLATHVARHLIERDAIDLGCRGGVDIHAALEGLDHVRILTEVRHDAQLDL